MPLISSLTTTIAILTLGAFLYTELSSAYHNHIIADIEQHASRFFRARCYRTVIVGPSNGDGIWSASLYWGIGDREVGLQAFATTETEALVRLRRIVRR